MRVNHAPSFVLSAGSNIKYFGRMRLFRSTCRLVISFSLVAVYSLNIKTTPVLVTTRDTYVPLLAPWINKKHNTHEYTLLLSSASCTTCKICSGSAGHASTLDRSIQMRFFSVHNMLGVCDQVQSSKTRYTTKSRLNNKVISHPFNSTIHRKCPGND